MSKICDVCGLPEELCVCEEIAREVQSLKVFTVRRRFGSEIDAACGQLRAKEVN